jgi:hypothetical protein
MAAAAAPDAQQLFLNAQAAAQLAVLPTFSNVFKDDNFTATQWLQKVLNHKNGAGWTDEQTITHVRNAFRGDLIDWYDSLAALGIDSKVWDNVKNSFETDFRAAPSVTSVVHKIPDIKQQENETVIQYFSKALKTMEEFKAKIRQMELVIPDFLLPVGQVEAFQALPQNTKDALNIHMRTHVAAQTLNQVSVLLITAGLKPSLRMEILKRENLNLAQIKDLALKYENLQQEKQTKSGNSSTINATDYTNEEEEEEDINAVRFQNSFRGNSNRGRNYNNRGNRGGANYFNPNANRGGQQTSQYRGNPARGGNPNRGNRGGSSSTQQYSQSQNNMTNQQGQKPTCKYCKKPGHTIEDCWTLQAKNKARGVNQVDQPQNEDEMFEDGTEQVAQVSSIFNSKN